MAKVCSIAPNKQQLEQLYQLVFKRIFNSKNQDKPFDMKALMNDVYNHRIGKGYGELDAIGFAEQIPGLVEKVAENKELRNYLRSKGFSLDKLADDVRDIDDSINKNSSVPFIKKYLGISQGNAQDIEAMKQALAQDNMDKVPEESETKEVVNVPLPIPNDLAVTEITMERFKATTPSMFTDRDQEALSMEKYLPNGQLNPNFNVPNPELAFYYTVKRNILQHMYDNNKSDSAEINYPRIGKVYLKIQSASTIAKEDLRPFTKRDKYGNPLPVTQEEIDQAHKEGVVMVITHSDGEPVRFNDQGEVDYNGKIAYYTLRVPRKDFKKEGEYFLSDVDNRTIEARARIKNEPYDVAKAYIIQELKALEELRSYIKKDPSKNHLMATIQGGSLGYTQFDYKTINTPIKSINFGTEAFNPEPAKLGDKSGRTYFTLKSMGMKPIEIERPALNTNPQLIDNLVSILTDKLVKKTIGGKIEPVTGFDVQQYVDAVFYTNKETLQVFSNPDGSYDIRLKGEKLDLSTPAAIANSKEILRNYFTQLGPQRKVEYNKLTKEQRSNIVSPGDPLKINSVIKVDNEYWIAEYPKIMISDTLLKKGVYNEPTLTTQPDGTVMVQTNPKSYADFIKENFTVHYELNAENKLLRLNSYFNYNVLDKEEEKIYGPDETLNKVEALPKPNNNLTEKGPADSNPDDLIDNAIDNPLLKNQNQKHHDVKATKEQMESAKTWYEKHPMSKSIPFHVMFNIVNTARPSAVATWAMHGITLYKGSDYTDLYHEAWHGFTQMFMTVDQKNKLYAETRNLTGSFTDFNGDRVQFSKASNLQLEEYLAEEFRTFMIKGKPAKPSPVKNSIFRKILDFLKALFGDLTMNEIALNERANKTIYDLFEKMRVGNLTEFNFSAQNTSFNSLNKGMERTDKEEPQAFLSYENSSMLVDTVDSMISQFIDMSNTGLKAEGRARLSSLLEKERLGERLTGEERSELEALQSKQTYRKTSTIVKTKDGRKAAYKYVKARLAALHQEFSKQLESADNETTKDLLQIKITTLKWAIDNFGDAEDLSKNVKGKGVIGYHILKSKFFPTEDKEEILDEMEQNSEEKFTREAYDKSGNEMALKDLASKEILYLLRSLHKKTKEGKDELNTLGVPELVPFDQVWNRLARLLQNTLDVNEMYDKIQQDSKTYPTFKQLLLKLGPVDTTGQYESELWTNFWQSFNKTSVPLVQMTVEATTLDPTTGLPLSIPSYHITIGDATGAHHRIKQRWVSNFATTRSAKYIKPGEGNNNFLDVPALLKDFNKTNYSGREFEFFRAIGIILDDTPEIREAVSKGVGGAKYIINKISNIHYEYKEAIKSLNDIFKDRPDLMDNGRKKISGKGEGKNFTDLAQLQGKYSDEASNFAVTNAEGNIQFEHTLNNSMTIMVNSINKARTYQELIDMPHMSYLDFRRNPWVKASVWLNSIFKLQDAQGNFMSAANPEFGQKRRQGTGSTDPYVKMNLTNMSGVAMKENGDFTQSGIASASADEFTKFILDFHSTLDGRPELMRHADKGTSFSVWLSNINGENSYNKRLYVDTSSFATHPSKKLSADESKELTDLVNLVRAQKFSEVNYNKLYELLNKNQVSGQDAAFKLIIPHISAELERINYMKDLKVDEGGFDFDYKERGKDFVTFDRVLSNATKEALKNLPVPLTEYLQSTDAAANKLKTMLNNDLLLYFEVQIRESGDLLNKVNNFVASTTVTENRGPILDKIGESVNDAAVKVAMVKSFVYNSWIHNLESLTVLYGDLALYKIAKEEFHKRNAGIGSTGNIYRTDRSIKTYINNVLGKPYTEKMVGKSSLYTGIFNTAVLTDNNLGSKYIDEYIKAIGDDIRTRLSKAGVSEEEIKKTIEGAIEPYKKMDEGDAQGWISFDSYRSLLVAEGKWNDTQEEMYQRIVKGEDIRDVEKFFPTQKLQYWGPLKTEGMPIMAFHKFSLFPLIPTVIKGTNLEGLHTKMMTEGIDYALFKTGSKIGTITKDGKNDELYNNNDTGARVISGKPFTSNYIYLEYLKNQLEIAPEYKGQVVFSTQMRKLIEDGLMEGGVPTDFMANSSLDERRKEWNKKDETDKRNSSDRYKLMKTYEDNIAKLTELKKEELLKKINWKRINNKLQGSLNDLIKFVKLELSRQDLSDHEIDFISVDPLTGELVNDLSMSLSSDKIERLLNAIVIKRLVRQKVNGEGLIQVSGAGFEKRDAYTNPSQKELSKWGTNDLPSYSKPLNKDGKPDYTKPTKAMKVKVALQGEFTKLLFAIHNDGEQIRTIERLNEMLKSEEWLNKGDNRRMITMVGTRIPVQGLNSMEFMEVYEFLPEEAGNIIVPPTEIVAKSGSDFDIDKLTVMMPTYQKKAGSVLINRGYTREEAKQLYEDYKKRKVERADSDLIEYATEMDWDVEQILNMKGDIKPFEDFYAILTTTKSIENDLIWNIKEILALPENFSRLIRPNGTDIVKTLADNLANDVMEYKPKDKVFPSDSKTISGTRVLEVQYNMYKHQSNNIGKQTLGLGAVDNTYNSLFNRIGAYMNPYTINEKASGIKKEKFEALLAKLDKGEVLSRSEQADYEKGAKFIKNQTLRLAHNTIDVDGKKAISLSHTLDKEGKNVISDVISQLMNGWVDIAKDAWIFNIQGNKEVAPVLLFMIQAGVPFETAVYLVSQPLVREYVNQQRMSKSTFAGPLNKAPKNPMFFRSKALEFILSTPKFGFNFTPSQLKGFAMNTSAYMEGVRLADQELGQGEFTAKGLKESMQNKEITDYQRAAFLHYIEIENMSKAVRDVKMRMNFDTTKDATLFEAQNRKLMIESLREDNRLPDNIVDDLLKDSPIKSFYIQDFQLEVWQDLFKLRDHPELNDFLINKFKSRETREDMDETYPDAEKFANEFRNDLISYIFQNAINDFNLDTISSYQGYKIVDETLKPVLSLTMGAFVKDGVMYVDVAKLKEQFSNGLYAAPKAKDHLLTVNGTAIVQKGAFTTDNQYYKFVFERENIRYINPFDTAVKTKDFDNFARVFGDSVPRLKDEEATTYNERRLGVLYEMWIRDKALDNTYNGWKLFESNDTYADQFMRIYDEFPELREKFSLMNNLVLSTTSKPNYKGYTNLKLADSRLDADKINVLYENLNTLANDTKQKVSNFEDNKRISEFFNRFAIVALLQSGINIKSSFSMTRIIPQEKFLMIMKQPVKDYTKNINSSILNDYYNKFVIQNNISSKSKRIRYKNYISTVTLKNAGKEKQVQSQYSRLSQYNKESIQYDPVGLTQALAKKLQEENPNTLFVFNTATEKFGSALSLDYTFYGSPFGNQFGLPTRKQFTGGPANENIYDVVIDGVPTLDPKFKEKVDVAIQGLKEASQHYVLAFNKEGYGQNLRTQKSRQNFLYLSEQLFNNFNFVNPGYTATSEGRRVIQSTQAITDEMVRDFMKHCLL